MLWSEKSPAGRAILESVRAVWLASVAKFRIRCEHCGPRETLPRTKEPRNQVIAMWEGEPPSTL
ncbi:hypothetical protein E2C01_005603 [Portunus trituberculatus]|uniref:Uncharacterized protein n=1 Tax=Portunus trituberculatus TaxID=210409 RepID=A0A5B7CTZ7_PORTR|nr:hypothetical protein [Portunus trituberculatus]